MDLMLVFIGLLGESEIPIILEEYGLIDELDCDEIYEKFGDGVDPERVLLTITRRAYFEFFNSSKNLN